jgi:hypothetical protein
MNDRVIRSVTLALVLLFGTLPLRAQQPFWRSTGGPNGRAITAIAVDSHRVLCAGTNGNGIYRSTNLGETWLPASTDPSMQTGSIGAIACDGKGQVIAVRGNQIFRSRDSDVQWEMYERIGGDFNTRYSFLLSQQGGDYIGVLGKGVFRTTDDGATWGQTNAGLGYGAFFPPSIGTRAIVAEPGGALDMADSNFVMRSTNAGDTWYHADTSLFVGTIRGLLVAHDGGIVVAVDQMATSTVYRSIDHGATWTSVLSSVGTSPLMEKSPEGRIVVILSTGIVQSNDHGATWQGVQVKRMPPVSHFIAWGGDTLVASGTTGVRCSFDGGATWIDRNNGFLATDVVSITAGVSGTLLAVAQGTGIHITSDSGAHWQSTGAPGTRFIVADTSGFAISDVAASTDGGTTWNYHNFTSTPYGAVIVAQRTAVMIGQGTVSRTTDAGSTWKRASGWPLRTASAIARAPSGTLYATGMRAGFGRSTDAGETWQVDTSNSSPLWTSRTTLLFVTHSGALLAVSDTVYRSTTGGAAWDTIANLPGGVLFSAIVQTRGDTLYASAGTDIYSSADDAVTWRIVPGATSCSNVESMLLAADHLWIGTSTCGVQASMSLVEAASNSATVREK